MSEVRSTKHGSFPELMSHPISEPLHIVRKDDGDPFAGNIKSAGEAAKYSVDALLTSGTRVAAPFLTAAGLTKKCIDKGGAYYALAPLAAAGGLVVGTAMGALGVLSDLLQSIFMAIVSTWTVAFAGMKALKKPTPEAHDAAANGAAALVGPPRAES